jgi:hypothetical protein
MTIIVILNVVLAVAIVASIVSLLGWGIASDRPAGTALPGDSMLAARRQTIRRNRRLRSSVARPSAAGRA